MNKTLSSKQITKKSGSNLALSFICLPKEQRTAMSTFYAFCRLADDIVDAKDIDPKERLEQISEWRREIDRCYVGTPESELGKELATIIRTYLIPPQFFKEILDGVEMDLTVHRYETFADLEKYCYRVASAVGLVSINIFGCTQAQSREYATALGMALQLTNILRDVRYDLLEYDRIYLPQDELKAFGITEDDLRNGVKSTGVKKLLRLQYFRAHYYFEKAKKLIHPKDYPHFSASLIMTDVYQSLLEKLRAHDFPLNPKPLKLTKFEKAQCVTRTWARFRFNPQTSFGEKPKKIAVWGGGFAGISAALHAALHGHQVDLYEVKTYLGGRAHSFKEAKTGIVLDNGQHILMGAYKSCLELIDLLGIQDKLDMQPSLKLDFISPQKGHTTLCTSNAAAPWHLLKALWNFNESTLLDKFSILSLGVQLRLGKRPRSTETVAQWLGRCMQTPGAIRALWEPLCIAALNEPTSTASAVLFDEVVRRSVLGTKEDGAVYTCKVGLSDFLMPEAALFLKSTGSHIFTSCGIKSVTFQENAISNFKTTDGKVHTYDSYISTLPSAALARLLPAEHAFVQQLRSIKSAPIIGIHIWTDWPIIKAPFVGLLDSPIHWIFDRTPTHAKSLNGQYLYALIVSGAYELMSKNSRELTELASQEINRLLPDTQGVHVLHSLVYKSLDATFAATPATELFRPGATSPFKNLILAGDWIQTGLPATLEGAVASGINAAKVLS